MLQGISLSEVDTNCQIEASVPRIIKTVLSDIGQSEVVAGFQIKHLITDTTTKSQPAVETIECVIFITKAAIGLAVVVVFNLSSYAACEVTAEERLHRHVALGIDLVFHEQWCFQVVQIVSKTRAIVCTLTALFGVIQSRLQENRCLRCELCTDSHSHIESSLRLVRVESGIV